MAGFGLGFWQSARARDDAHDVFFSHNLQIERRNFVLDMLAQVRCHFVRISAGCLCALAAFLEVFFQSFERGVCPGTHNYSLLCRLRVPLFSSSRNSFMVASVLRPSRVSA